MPRFVLTAGLALALAVVPSASSGIRKDGVAAGVPGALHAFLLRADEQRMLRRLAVFAKIARRRHNAAAEVVLPQAVHQHTSR